MRDCLRSGEPLGTGRKHESQERAPPHRWMRVTRFPFELDGKDCIGEENESHVARYSESQLVGSHGM